MNPKPQPNPLAGLPLAMSLDVEREYAPDREAMLAALRVVLGLPNPTRFWLEGRGE